METSRTLKTQNQKSHSVTSVVHHWSQQVTGPDTDEGDGKETSSFDKSDKVTAQAAGGMGEIVATFENIVPSTCERNQNKKQRKVKVKVTQQCPTLCDPMDYTVHGILQAEYWSGQPFPSPGDLPNPGT